MLGHTLLYELHKHGFNVSGTVRFISPLQGLIPQPLLSVLKEGIDASNITSIDNYIKEVKPDIVINCIGLIKQLPEGKQALPCIEINAAFPHKLYEICKKNNCRLIHYSSDCVFDGQKRGLYSEDDPVTAKDYYGITKYLGELHEYPALTIRTSIIGHELRNKRSLIEWFLSQNDAIYGYSKVLFTGLPTVEHAKILSNYIIPNPKLYGLFQVASLPISKYELLQFVANQYNKKIEIIPEKHINEERCLSFEKFKMATGYSPPDWLSLIIGMYNQFQNYKEELL